MLKGCFGESNWQYFNLAKIDDGLGVNSKQPANLFYNGADSADHLFQFSVCQAEFNINPAESTKTGRVKQSSTIKSSKADATLAKYSGEGEKTEPASFQAENTFGNPRFAGYYVEENKYNGFLLNYTSKQACTSDSTKKQTIILMNKCNKDKKTDKIAYSYQSSVSMGCVDYFTYEGDRACMEYDLTAIKGYLKFAGAVEILAGAVLCFYGLAILSKALAGLCFLGVYAVVFGLGNVFFFGKGTTPIIVFAILGFIAASVATYFFFKVIKEWGTAVLLGATGFVCGLIVVSPMAFLPPWVRFGIVIAAVICAAVLGKSFNEQIQAYGTAIIGAGLVIHGLG